MQKISFNISKIATYNFRSFYTETREKNVVLSSRLYRMLHICNELNNVDFFIDDKAKLKCYDLNTL